MVVSSDEKLTPAPPFESHIRSVVVAGVSSGVGKTLVAEAVTAVLAGRHRTAGAKITVTHGERGCPHGGKGCDVCGSLGGDFQIITRPQIITQRGTDSARLCEAGASPVLWAITRAEFIEEAWRAMKRLMSVADCAVIESNTLAERIRPALTLMVADPTASRRLWKASAGRLLAAADLVIFNDRGPERKRTILLEEIQMWRGSTEGLIFVRHPSEVKENAALLKRLDDMGRVIRAPEDAPRDL